MKVWVTEKIFLKPTSPKTVSMSALTAVRNLIRKRLTLDTLPSNHAEAATA